MLLQKAVRPTVEHFINLFIHRFFFQPILNDYLQISFCSPHAKLSPEKVMMNT